jgi:hypothetical protein
MKDGARSDGCRTPAHARPIQTTLMTQPVQCPGSKHGENRDRGSWLATADNPPAPRRKGNASSQCASLLAYPRTRRRTEERT